MPLIVDGGLATSLEARGYVLHPTLWSAGVFLEDPGAIEDLHVSFLEAGAGILISASYQMSFDGLSREGFDREAAAGAMLRTIEVAIRARERFGRADAKVAASIGPYGATLCDGSEYRGDYGLSVDQLRTFHRDRMVVLAGAGADLLAIETIPSVDETEALLSLLDEVDGPDAWISFTGRNEREISDGTSIAEVASMCSRSERVFAIGVNCTAPEYVSGLIDEIRRVSTKRVIVYPNSGEVWDRDHRGWTGEASDRKFIEHAREWSSKGVWAIGGCCRIGPEEIRDLAMVLSAGAVGHGGPTLPSHP